ncbi:hypothetical protein GCM10009757_16820 [Streptomyces cheonanensis]|uniref:Uncharacterized protein n=1 Tax=Streptomyces cheonanensis TaxID=312720 RepID=A0ABP5GIZ1_9ACTN
MVALRSPARTTPPENVAATIVVPCGICTGPSTGGSIRLPGSRSGAISERKSKKEEDPGLRKAAGSRPWSWELPTTEVLPGHGNDPAAHGAGQEYARDPTRHLVKIHIG